MAHMMGGWWWMLVDVSGTWWYVVWVGVVNGPWVVGCGCWWCWWVVRHEVARVVVGDGGRWSGGRW